MFIPVPGVDLDADGIDDRIAIDIVQPQETDAGLNVPAIVGPSPYGCRELDALISALAVVPANGLDAPHAAALTADVRRIAAVYGCASA